MKANVIIILMLLFIIIINVNYFYIGTNAHQKANTIRNMDFINAKIDTLDLLLNDYRLFRTEYVRNMQAISQKFDALEKTDNDSITNKDNTK